MKKIVRTGLSKKEKRGEKKKRKKKTKGRKRALEEKELKGIPKRIECP